MRVEPRFVGTLRMDQVGGPGSASNEWRLRNDYGFLRRDNLLVVAPATAHVNGASIPRLAWPLLGHPMAGENKYWSVHHDCGYRGTVIVIDMSTVACPPETAMWAMEYMQGARYVHSRDLSRRWHDGTMRQALAVCSEPIAKRQLVYAVVRLAGWLPWRKNHKHGKS